MILPVPLPSEHHWHSHFDNILHDVNKYQQGNLVKMTVMLTMLGMLLFMMRMRVRMMMMGREAGLLLLLLLLLLSLLSVLMLLV